MQFIFFLLAFVGISLADWTISLEYSLNGFTNSYPLGSIEMRKIYDGNYTGTYKPVQEKTFGQKLIDGQDALYQVRAKSSTQPGVDFLTTSDACLFLRSNLFHVFWVAVNQEKQQLNTITVFPDSVAWHKDEESKYISLGKTCKEKSGDAGVNTNFGESSTPKGVVHVVNRGVLPSPDTASFVQRIEKEKRAKQHGADADNRSFLAKYWMYIVPVVIFAMISSAVNPEAGGEGAAQ